MNFRKWLYGLAATIIGSGSTAISTGFGTILVDPKKFNVHDGLGHLLEVMGMTFAIAALTHAAAYLSQSPLPPPPASWDGSDRRKAS